MTRGIPMVHRTYNNDFQIVQTPGYVVILHEMIHETRIIPVDNRPHLPANVGQWLGDARGHWDGNTLVVEGAHFSEKTNFRGSSTALHHTERFTPTGPNS